MILEVFEDDLTLEDLSDIHFHSSRAIIKKNNQVLLLFSKKLDYYMLPGGRIEIGETPDQCVVREVLEETGFSVEIAKKSVQINEHFTDSNWHTHYYICNLLDKPKVKLSLTDEEKSIDIEEVWISYLDVLDLLDSYDSSFSKGYNIMQREFLALTNSL